MSGEENNPFAGNDDAFNPFAANNNVAAYNPFPTAPSAQPRLVVNTSPKPIRDDDQPFGKIDDSFYDGDSPMQELNRSSSEEEELQIRAPETKRTMTGTNTTASGARVHVTTSEEKADEGESVWTIEFYQQFFNVDTTEVMWRCLRSLWPFKLNFIQFVRTNPDFYGPFWITTTLIFMLAAGSNFASYLANTDGDWHYDFFKLTAGAGIIWGYAFGAPVLYWLYFKWVDLNVSLIEMLCIYGYSLFSYTPVALLNIIQNPVVPWVVVIIACLISTSFLIVNMWTPLRSKIGHAVLILFTMACLHVGFGLCVQLYWFQFVGGSSPAPIPSPTPTPVPTPIPAPK